MDGSDLARERICYNFLIPQLIVYAVMKVSKVMFGID